MIFNRREYYRGPVQHVFVPVNIQGLGNGELLDADRTSARLVMPDGRTLELGEAPGLTVFRGGAFHQSIAVPQEIWNLVKDQPVRLEIDYSLTMLKAGADRTIPALAGNQWVPETGRCATRMNSDDTADRIRLSRCPAITRVSPPSFRDARTGQITAQDRDCRPDYAPYFGRLEGDSLSRLRGLPGSGRECFGAERCAGWSCGCTGQQRISRARLSFRISSLAIGQRNENHHFPPRSRDSEGANTRREALVRSRNGQALHH